MTKMPSTERLARELLAVAVVFNQADHPYSRTLATRTFRNLTLADSEHVRSIATGAIVSAFPEQEESILETVQGRGKRNALRKLEKSLSRELKGSQPLLLSIRTLGVDTERLASSFWDHVDWYESSWDLRTRGARTLNNTAATLDAPALLWPQSVKGHSDGHRAGETKSGGYLDILKPLAVWTQYRVNDPRRHAYTALIALVVGLGGAAAWILIFYSKLGIPEQLASWVAVTLCLFIFLTGATLDLLVTTGRNRYKIALLRVGEHIFPNGKIATEQGVRALAESVRRSVAEEE